MNRPCEPGKVRNPLTNRCVKVDGRIGKTIVVPARHSSPRRSPARRSSPRRSPARHSSPRRSPVRSARRNATDLNNSREAVLYNLLVNKSVSNDVIRDAYRGVSAEKIRDLVNEIHTRYPLSVNATRKGGLGARFDLKWNALRVELKYANKVFKFKQLEQRPWSASVQFLQGQVTNPKFRQMLGALGRPMLDAFYETIKDRVNMPLARYIKTITSIDKSNDQQELRRIKNTLTRAWDTFSEGYLRNNLPNANEVERVVKDAINNKNVWIVVTRSHQLLFENIRVNTVRFDQVKKERKRIVYMYTMNMTNQTETYDVPLRLRIYWKNGGQGVSNPNFLLS